VAALLAGCGPSGPLGKLPAGVERSELNVLLITLDTTRADRIGAYARPRGLEAPATPRLDELAARGTRFDNAVSVTPLTLPAHCTLMTGLLPAAHGVRDNGGFRLDPARRTLAEAFAAAGFRTGGFVSAYVLDHKWGIGQGFERYFDDFDLAKVKTSNMGEIQRRGDETVARATAWIDEVAPAGRFFAWVHLYDPHTPYAAPEPFASAYPHAPYNGEIAWTDSLVGDLLDHLAGRGLDRETLVVVMGDHGESLGDHGEADHGFFVYDATQQVPFLLAGPFERLAGQVVTAAVGQADLAPTLLELAGVAGGLEPGQGRSLVPLLAGEADPEAAPPRGYSEIFLPRFHYGWSELRALRTERWHFIEAPRAELYDVVADPRETTNLADRERRVTRDLRQALAALDATVRPATAGSAPLEEDEETLRALAALGYLGGQGMDESKSFRDLPDPKDRLDVYARMSRARGLAKSDEPAEAIPLLEAVLAEDPEVVDAWFTLGNVHFRQHDWERAAENYRQTLARRPDHDWAMIGLADTYVARGQIDEAVAGYRRYLQGDAGNAQIQYRLAQVLVDAGRDAEAAAAFGKTLEVEPKTARAEVGLAIVAFRAQRFPEAHAALDRALGIDAAAKWAHYNRALLLEQEGRTAEAVAAYRKEIEIQPEATRAMFNLGRLLERQGDGAGALAEYRRAVAADDGFQIPRFFLARGLLAAGDLDGAAREARAALEKDPDGAFSPLGHYVLADVASRRGDPREADRQARLGRALEARRKKVPA
jgi:arylsulfatase A-like enzyme/Tfp pilus assembly protein PilF